MIIIGGLLALFAGLLAPDNFLASILVAGIAGVLLREGEHRARRK